MIHFAACLAQDWNISRPYFPRFHLIDITPHPRLTRLNRANERMMHFTKVFGRVLVLGRITTPYMPARQTQPQMHPRIPHLDALFANTLVGVLNFNLIEMRALILHGSSRMISTSGQVTSVM
jgi:hypothetical protein